MCEHKNKLEIEGYATNDVGDEESAQAIILMNGADKGHPHEKNIEIWAWCPDCGAIGTINGWKSIPFDKEK